MDKIKEEICEILFKRSDYDLSDKSHVLHERNFNTASEEILEEIAKYAKQK